MRIEIMKNQVGYISKLLLLITLTALPFSLLFSQTTAAVEITLTTPAIDSTIAIPPNFVTITADQELLEFGNEITVISPSNLRVDDGLLTVDGKTISVGIGELTESGKYLVEYELVVNNDAPLFGNYSFIFQGPPAINEPTPDPTLPTSEESGREIGSDATDYLVIGLLVFTFFLLMWLARFARSTFRRK
jgi:methionine-rich copper-binding protein CopC